MRSLSLSFSLFAALLAGCGTGEPGDSREVEILAPGNRALVDATFQTGSSTIAHHRSTLFNVNTDNNTVTALDTENNELLAEILVGSEPTRLAVVGDQIVVTLRGERSIAVIDALDLSAAPQIIEVGAEPFGVIAREDGQRVYVALSQEEAILELDGSSFELLRTIPVSGEPRYLALHPSGASLYVGSARGVAKLTQVDLQTGSTVSVPLPETRRFTLESEISLVGRITGDLWITPDGENVLVPTLYADNQTPILEVVDGQVEPQPEQEVEGYGGSGADSVDKFTPSVVEVPTNPLGGPEGDSRALFVSLTNFTVNGFQPITTGSYLSSVSASPDGETYLVTMEASRSAVFIDADSWVFGGQFGFEPSAPPQNDSGDLFMDPAVVTLPEEGGFAPPALLTVETGDGANGAIFMDSSRAFVNNAFAGSVSHVRTSDAFEMLQQMTDSGMNFPDMLLSGTERDVSPSTLPADVQLGRDLFYGARNSTMGQGGISCSTCHVDGRNDGMTWTFQSGLRQTPSLAGVVSETAPVTWTSNVPSVAHEADITTRARMGGEGMSDGELSAIAAYVDWTRPVDTPMKGVGTDAFLRGQAIFHRSEVGCANCHTGQRFTDNNAHTIRGVEGLNTPALNGIAATGPYLHDGSMATLRDVLDWARTGEMGDTSSLTEAEMRDLEAYLRGL